MTDETFEQRAERLAEAFCARYGVMGAWSDKQIDVALHEHNLPCLGALPAEPRGMMADTFAPPHGPLDAVEARRWQRTNAMHLLAHVMLHDGVRCPGCRDWGTDDG